MSLLEGLLVKVGADIRPLVQGLAGAVDQTAKAGRRINSVLDTMSASFKTLGAVVGAAAIQSFAGSALDMADALIDLTEVTGATTNSIQELRYAATKSGGSIEEMDAALQKFAANVGDAASGSGALYATLNRLNISVRDDVTGSVKSLDDLLGDLAEALSDAGSEQEMLSIATDAFGKQAGPMMVRVLKDGREGLDEFRYAANEAGVVIDETLLIKAKEVNEQWESFTYLLEVRTKSAILGLINPIDTLAGSLRDMNSIGIEGISNTLTLEEQIASVKAKIAEAKKAAPDPTWSMQDYAVHNSPEMKEAEALLAVLEQQLKIRNTLKGTGYSDLPTSTLPPLPKHKPVVVTDWKPEVERTVRLTEAEKEHNAVMAEGQRMTESLRTATEEREAGMERLNELLEAGAISDETALRQIIRLDEQMQKTSESTEDLGEKLSVTLNESIKGFGKAILSAESFSNALGNMINRFAEIGIDSAFDSLFGKGKSIDVGSILGGFFGARATGGPTTGGTPYLVGERGPELFVPGASGAIVPNSKLSGMGSNVAVNISIDARGAENGAADRLAAVAAQIQTSTFNAVFSAIGRGGQYAKSTGRR